MKSGNRLEILRYTRTLNLQLQYCTLTIPNWQQLRTFVREPHVHVHVVPSSTPVLYYSCFHRESASSMTVSGGRQQEKRISSHKSVLGQTSPSSRILLACITKKSLGGNLYHFMRKFNEEKHESKLTSPDVW